MNMKAAGYTPPEHFAAELDPQEVVEGHRHFALICAPFRTLTFPHHDGEVDPDRKYLVSARRGSAKRSRRRQLAMFPEDELTKIGRVVRLKYGDRRGKANKNDLGGAPHYNYRVFERQKVARDVFLQNEIDKRNERRKEIAKKYKAKGLKRFITRMNKNYKGKGAVASIDS